MGSQGGEISIHSKLKVLLDFLTCRIPYVYNDQVTGRRAGPPVVLIDSGVIVNDELNNSVVACLKIDIFIETFASGN
jgi:hypothetical protein